MLISYQGGEERGSYISSITLFDDDRNIMISVSITLESEGFTVETYNDGQTALDAFNRSLPDLSLDCPCKQKAEYA